MRAEDRQPIEANVKKRQRVETGAPWAATWIRLDRGASAKTVAKSAESTNKSGNRTVARTPLTTSSVFIVKYAGEMPS